MPQALLPLIPAGATLLNDRISVVKDGAQWTYFCGIHPVFVHPEEDRASFRMFTAQLVCQGVCKQADIIRTFGVSANSVRRSVAKYNAEGAAGFFRPRRTRGATVLTEEVITQAQALLSQGSSRRQAAEQLNIRYDTLRKAIHQGRLHEPSKATKEATLEQGAAASDQSARSMADAAAEMGVACTRPGERVLAAMGMLQGAPTQFENCRDVSFGGVLCGLPALVANGLFEHLQKVFPLLGGYYTTLQVITLLAYMALCRIKTAEQLQYESPGELGKLMGLDRVPEVRCLRNKLSQLSAGDAPAAWAGLLSAQWLEAAPERTGTLYVDGHVRVYHGRKTALPRRYVARQRLCLRGTTDYWVNDALGLPFFAVERPIDHGLLEALKSLISTAYGELAAADVASLFSRWSQENFFRYMMEHYAIDLLSEYQTEEIPGTNRPVVNPRWRELDRRYRSAAHPTATAASGIRHSHASSDFRPRGPPGDHAMGTAEE